MRYQPDGRVNGWDMGAALALASVRGIAEAAAELLPAAEMGLRAGLAEARERAGRAAETDEPPEDAHA